MQYLYILIASSRTNVIMNYYKLRQIERHRGLSNRLYLIKIIATILFSN
jgi:hypothetical protein